MTIEIATRTHDPVRLYAAARRARAEALRTMARDAARAVRRLFSAATAAGRPSLKNV